MLILKRGVPVTLAILVGLVAFVALLFVPSLAEVLLNWAGYLAAAALLLGVLNLLAVHAKRSAGGNVYSMVLVTSMLAVVGLAITDALGQTQQGVETMFRLVQVPLEAALASLVAFFLLFASVRMMRSRLNVATTLFLVSTLFFLLTQPPGAEVFWAWLLPIRFWIESVVVVAGMRGLLLGIALGVITLAVRLLVGIERPYTS